MGFLFVHFMCHFVVVLSFEFGVCNSLSFLSGVSLVLSVGCCRWICRLCSLVTARSFHCMTWCWSAGSSCGCKDKSCCCFLFQCCGFYHQEPKNRRNTFHCWKYLALLQNMTDWVTSFHAVIPFFFQLYCLLSADVLYYLFDCVLWFGF